LSCEFISVGRDIALYIEVLFAVRFGSIFRVEVIRTAR